MYGMVNCCYGMSHFLCTGLVELIVIAQAHTSTIENIVIPIQYMMNVDRQLSV